MKKQTYIFKFKDLRDGNHAFILACSIDAAKERMKQLTEIKCDLIDTKPVEEIGTWTIFNKINEK